MTHDDDQLAAWLSSGPAFGPAGAVENALAAAHRARQRPGWMVAATGGTIGTAPRTGVLRYAVILGTVIALVGIVLGAMIVGRILPPPRPAPSVLPIVSPSESPAAAATSSPSATPSADVGLVAFTQVDELQPGEGQCTADSQPFGLCSVKRAWLAGADGSDPHQLLPGIEKDTPLAWTPDGAGLLVQMSSAGRLVIMDPNGTVTVELAYDELCALPCAGLEGFDFSPDGTRLAFVRSYPDVDNGSVIAVMDWATGVVTELEATRTTNTSIDQCFQSPGCQGLDGKPRWSHDGSQLVFERQGMSPEPSSTQGSSAALFTVNADGTGLRRVTREGLYAVDPHWSPDDETLLFTRVDLPGPDQRTFIDTIRPDGTNLQQLTDDAESAFPAWTLSGRVTFARSGFGATYDDWIMDADGGNPTQLGSTLAELTAAGCMNCLYPVPTADLSDTARALWQPAH